MKLAICLAWTLLSLPVWSLETDNYFAWTLQLNDSSSRIDEFFNQQIAEQVSQTPSASCEELTDKVAKRFASYLVHDDPIAQWLMPRLSVEEIRPADFAWVAESIYRDPFRFYIPKFGLAPNIQVNDVYFGLDKLSHFGATGKLYYDRYRKALKSGRSEAEARQAAIDHGIREEKTLYGYWASGVFSYADLEADYQGMLFYLDLCAGSTAPFVRKDAAGQWTVAAAFSIAKYVNGNWDETFNPSYRLPGNWQKVAPVLKAEYCDLRHTPIVLERMNHYQTMPASFSVSYLATLDVLPDPREEQDFEALCEGY